MLLNIDTQGNIKALADGPAEVSFAHSLGHSKVQRGGHVQPRRLALRLAFRLLRKLCGAYGCVGNWTRRWSCIWQSDLSPQDGPILGPFSTRSEAIAAEVAWLTANWLEAKP